MKIRIEYRIEKNMQKKGARESILTPKYWPVSSDGRPSVPKGLRIVFPRASFFKVFIHSKNFLICDRVSTGYLLIEAKSFYGCGLFLKVVLKNKFLI